MLPRYHESRDRSYLRLRPRRGVMKRRLAKKVYTGLLFDPHTLLFTGKPGRPLWRRRTIERALRYWLFHRIGGESAVADHAW